MYQWKVAPEAQSSFSDLPAEGRKALAAFMDAAVAADPMEFQRSRGEHDGNLRTLPFGRNDEGLVVFLVWVRGDLVLVVQITWTGP